MKTLMKLLALAGLMIPLSSEAAPRLGYFTFGPMLHWNYSTDQFKSFSFGFEVAYWTFTKDLGEEPDYDNLPDLNKPGYGVDLGFDTNLKVLRIYAEPEIGWALAGLSVGPVLELSGMGQPPQFGIQASSWVNVIGGADFRYRRLGGENFQAVGLYGKLATLISKD